PRFLATGAAWARVPAAPALSGPSPPRQRAGHSHRRPAHRQHPPGGPVRRYLGSRPAAALASRDRGKGRRAAGPPRPGSRCANGTEETPSSNWLRVLVRIPIQPRGRALPGKECVAQPYRLGEKPELAFLLSPPIGLIEPAVR